MASTAQTIIFSPARSSEAAFPKLPLYCCIALLLFCTVLQKLAVPGSNGALAITLVAVVAITGLLMVHGSLLVNSQAFITFAVFVGISAIAAALSQSPQMSLLSWCLLCVVQVPLIFRFAPGQVYYERLLNFVSTLGVFLAIGGVIQLVVQSVSGSSIAFWIDYNLPVEIALQGFNKLNAMAWGLEVYKSNGVFFSEPSCFSQFLAIALLAEFLVKARPLRVFVLAAGILSSYSGTGLMTLAAFSLFYLPRERRLPVAISVTAFALVLLVAGDVLNLDAITSRTGEFTDPNSSGHARFVSIFPLFKRVLFTDALTLLFGRGPGTVTEYFNNEPFDMFAPTYAKLLYEYGLLGFVSYMVFFYFAIIKSRAPLGLPLSFTYFLLGGYLLDAAMIAQLAVLAGWTTRTPDR